jgi:ketosteroid isomerase-like protein
VTVKDSITVVREFTDGLRAGDVPACLDLLDEANVFSEADSLPFGGDYVGRNGFLGMLRAVNRDFRVDLEQPEIAAAGCRILVTVRGMFTSRVTGRSLALDCVDLYQVRDGKIVRVDVFYKDSHALTELCREEVAAAATGQPHSTTPDDRDEFR